MDAARQEAWLSFRAPSKTPKCDQDGSCAIREDLVMSISASVGTELNLLEETADHCRQLHMAQPVLTSYEMEQIRQIAPVVDRYVPAARTAQPAASRS